MFSNPYAMALQVQDASNLSGVARELPRLLDLAREDLSKRGETGDSRSLATHPAIQLYMAKLMELSEIGIADDAAYSKAFAICQSRKHQAISEVEA